MKRTIPSELAHRLILLLAVVFIAIIAVVTLKYAIG